MTEDLLKATEILKNGGIILYPTDSIWGIGCDATNKEAVARIYQLKQREETKSMLVLVENENRLLRHVKEVPEIAWMLIEVNDRPMTVIYPGAINLAPNLIGNDQTIGIRIVKDEFCVKLISKINRPLVSTSANVSGQPSPAFFGEISDEIKNGVDYIVSWRQEDREEKTPSQIIKLRLNGEIEIIRK